MDTNGPEFQAALRDHAKSLGVDPDTESDLLDLVQEALLAPVPEDWEQGETEDGTLYYYNAETETSIWEHPLDAHYRELIQTKRNNKDTSKSVSNVDTKSIAHVDTKSVSNVSSKPVSNVEVYSFDEESDDENKTKPSVVETKTSRISSLFSMEPVPSYSATSAAMTSNAQSTKPVVQSTPLSGFGRDRSWLLDEEDSIPIPVKDSTTRTNPTSSSTSSFTSRLFGLNSNLTISTSSPPPIEMESGKMSPHRGIASSIKETSTISTAAHEADQMKIKQLEKKIADVTTQLETTQTAHERTKHQLETIQHELEMTKQQMENAQQDAKEANYTKMKLGELKTKVQERENEIVRLQTELGTTHKRIPELEMELETVQKRMVGLEMELETREKRLENMEIEKTKHMNQEVKSIDMERNQLQVQLTNAYERLEREGKEQERIKEEWKKIQERFEQEIQQYQTREKQHLESLTMTQQEIQKIQKQQQEMELEMIKQQEMIKKQEEMIKKQEEMEMKWKRQIQELQEQNQRWKEQIEEKEKQIFDLQQQTKEEKRVSQQQLLTRQERIDTLEIEIQTIRQENHTQQDVATQLSMLRTQIGPLEKQRDQIEKELERAHEKLVVLEQDIRTTRQERHEIQIEMDGWKRKEQSQKTQKEAYLQAKTQLETQYQALETTYHTYQYEKRMEIEKLVYRVKELESMVSQKDYELVRTQEQCTKAEGWRMKEAKRVEEQETQVLILKQELGQIKNRPIENELLQLRQERETLEQQVKIIKNEKEQLINQLQTQQAQQQAETVSIQQAIQLYIPQLAAISVQRASEEWQVKCQERIEMIRQELEMKNLIERNSWSVEIKTRDDTIHELQRQTSQQQGECGFLHKEIERLEETNRVLMEQLHTIRVYLTQRPLSNTSTEPHVTQLNTQLAMLHAQFQQLLKPSPPISTERREPRASTSSLDHTLETILDQSKRMEPKYTQQEALLASLASIGETKRSTRIIPVESTSQWYQKHYWKKKYQTEL